MNPEELVVQKAAEDELRKEMSLRFDPWLFRCFRVAKGLKQSEVADLCGFSPTGYKQILLFEGYSAKVGPVTLARLAGVLGIPESELLTKGATWKKNKAKHDAWVADNRPPLAAWLRGR
jgi:transcriptional regulator with XRE-family HTH domain